MQIFVLTPVVIYNWADTVGCSFVVFNFKLQGAHWWLSIQIQDKQFDKLVYFLLIYNTGVYYEK